MKGRPYVKINGPLVVIILSMQDAVHEEAVRDVKLVVVVQEVLVELPNKRVSGGFLRLRSRRHTSGRECGTRWAATHNGPGC
jgi:hypothetical protein